MQKEVRGMNYGADAADQMVRYTLEGVEHTVKLSGAVAKNLAVFIAAVIKSQKKTKGRTRMDNMLREKRPFKFFTVPDDKLKQFAKAAKARGLLYVIVKDKKQKTNTEIMIFADDAAKMNRVLDKIGIDYAKADYGNVEFVSEREKLVHEPELNRVGAAKGEHQTEHATGAGEKTSVKTQTIELPEGTIEFEVDEQENVFDLGEIGNGNFMKAQEEKNLSGTSLRSRDSSSGAQSERGENRTSVRQELKEIKQEQAKKRKKTAQRQRNRQNTQSRKKRRSKGKGR